MLNRNRQKNTRDIDRWLVCQTGRCRQIQKDCQTDIDIKQNEIQTKRYRLLDGDIKILVDRERNRLLIVEMNRKRDRDRRDRVRKTRQKDMRLINRYADQKTDSQKERCRQIARQTNKQKNKQAEIQRCLEIQAERNKKTDMQRQTG